MKRLAIYATYNKQGKVEDYVIYMLQKLLDVAEDVCVVSNKELEVSEKEKLSAATWIYERDDDGYDVGGYAYAIGKLQETSELGKYDELILLNDSIFGPFYSLSSMFQKMDAENKKLDFWSITRRGISDFDGGSEIYPEHLQIYFYVIKDKMLHSSDFAEYWKTIAGQITDFRSAIVKYEFMFTKHFEDLGYNWDSYCKCEDFITQNPKNNLSPYHYGMYNLVKDEKCPFLKRKLFTGDFVEKKYTDARDLNNTIDYISKNSDYDMNMIWKHVLANYQISDIMRAMHMTEVVNDDYEKEEWADIVKQKTKIIDWQMDTENKSVIVARTSQITICIDVDQEILPRTLCYSYFNNAYLNLIYNRKYLEKVLDMFEKDSLLGAVIPPIGTFGQISKSFEKRWCNENKFREIKEKYNLTVPCSQKRAASYEIHGFIARNNVVSPQLLDDIRADKSKTTLQMIPLFAQQAGYYTKTIINQKYVSSAVDNLMEIIETMWKGVTDYGENLNIDEMNDTVYGKMLLHFLNKTDHVYIYGAGVLGCRVAKIVKNKTLIKGFLVTDSNGNADIIDGIRVKTIDTLKDKNTPIIVAVGQKNSSVVSASLKRKGFENFIIIQ